MDTLKPRIIFSTSQVASLTSKVQAQEIHPGKPWIVTAHKDGEILVWNYELKRIVFQFSLIGLEISMMDIHSKNEDDSQVHLNEHSQSISTSTSPISPRIQHTISPKSIPKLNHLPPSLSKPFQKTHHMQLSNYEADLISSFTDFTASPNTPRNLRASTARFTESRREIKMRAIRCIKFCDIDSRKAKKALQVFFLFLHYCFFS
jgi:hypothetical protein